MYTFSVRLLSESPFFDRGEWFSVEIFYADDLKVKVDFPVVKNKAVVYRALSLVPSEGIYTVLDEFE